MLFEYLFVTIDKRPGLMSLRIGCETGGVLPTLVGLCLLGAVAITVRIRQDVVDVGKG